MNKGMSKRDRLTIKYVLLVILCALFLIPLILLVRITIITEADLFTRPPVLFFKPTLQAYSFVLKRGVFVSCLLNSLIVASSVTFVSIIVSLPAAYSLARSKALQKQSIGFFILAFRMVPAAVLVIPIFLIAANYGLVNTRLSLILVYTAWNLPFVTWLLRSYMDKIPVEVEEAAMTDGASRITTLVKIVLPLSLPGIFAVAIFCFLLSWNEFIFALTLTSSPKAQTLPVYITGFMEAFGTNWGNLATSTLLMILPALAFGIFAQRYLVKGLSVGIIK